MTIFKASVITTLTVKYFICSNKCFVNNFNYCSNKFVSNDDILIMYLCSFPYELAMKTIDSTFEPRREKTNVLHMRKQRRRSASR